MKKILSFLVLSIALVGCKVAESELKPIEYLKVNHQMINFDEMSDYGYLSIESNASWTAECAETWLELSIVTGTGDDLIKISTTSNFSTDERNATIIITSEGGISKNVYVKQNQLDFNVQGPSVGVLGREIEITGKGLTLVDQISIQC